MFRKSLDSEKPLIKVCENSVMLIVAYAGEKFTRDYLTSGTQENRFIQKVSEATEANRHNPLQALWRPVSLKSVHNNGEISSGRLSDKHRVLWTLRFVPALSKLVILLLADDPNHQYKIDGVKKVDGYFCGSTPHWNSLIRSIQNKNFIKIAESAEEKTLAMSTVPVKTPQNVVAIVMKTDGPELSDASDDVQIKKSVPPLKNENVEVDAEPLPLSTPRPVLPDTESKEEVGEVKKKKKKKKKKVKDTTLPATSTGTFHEEDGRHQEEGIVCSSEDRLEKLYEKLMEASDLEFFGKSLAGMIRFPNYREIVIGLLNRGLNPDITCGKNATLMGVVIAHSDIEMVGILLNRGVSMDRMVEETRITYLEMSINNHEDTEITRLLIQKTKENGDLDKSLPGRDYTVLHLAVKMNNVAAVRMLCEAGASSDVATKMNVTPLSMARYALKRLSLPAQEQKKLREMIEIMSKKSGLTQQATVPPVPLFSGSR